MKTQLVFTLSTVFSSSKEEEMVTVSSAEFCGWEAHTRGIGSKLLLKMGYELGKGTIYHQNWNHRRHLFISLELMFACMAGEIASGVYVILLDLQLIMLIYNIQVYWNSFTVNAMLYTNLKSAYNSEKMVFLACCGKPVKVNSNPFEGTFQLLPT